MHILITFMLNVCTGLRIFQHMLFLPHSFLGLTLGVYFHLHAVLSSPMHTFSLSTCFSLIGHLQVYKLVLYCWSLQGNCYCCRFIRFVLCSHALVRFLQFLAVKFTLVLVWGNNGCVHFAEFYSLCLVVGHVNFTVFTHSA